MCDRVRTRAELDAALVGGGEILVDSAVKIELSEPVIITRPVAIHGGWFSVPHGPGFQIRSSDVELDGLRIDGPGLPYYYQDGIHKLVHAQGTASTPLSGISIHDCVFDGSAGDNVWLEWCTGARIVDNTISRFRYSGVMVISGRGVQVRGNDIFDSPLIAPVVNNYGIAVTDLDNTEASRSRDCSIIGNTVHLIDWEGIDTHGGGGLVVSGNTVTACPRGIALVGGNDTRVSVPQGCVVFGNHVDGRGARVTLREGILIGGIPNKPADAVITGNRVSGYASALFADYYDRGLTFIGGNEPAFVPWTPMVLDGDFDPHATYPPEYGVDGNTVHIRGGVTPKSAAQRTVIGRLANPAAWPEELTFVGYAKGSNEAAGNGMVAAYPDGVLRLVYTSGTDMWTYFLSGSYQAI
jgi:hypothetical protein